MCSGSFILFRQYKVSKKLRGTWDKSHVYLKFVSKEEYIMMIL
jgi:hypothetical protein